jgi:hypothetical protein
MEVNTKQRGGWRFPLPAPPTNKMINAVPAAVLNNIKANIPKPPTNINQVIGNPQPYPFSDAKANEPMIPVVDIKKKSKSRKSGRSSSAKSRNDKNNKSRSAKSGRSKGNKKINK